MPKARGRRGWPPAVRRCGPRGVATPQGAAASVPRPVRTHLGVGIAPADCLSHGAVNGAGHGADLFIGKHHGDAPAGAMIGKNFCVARVALPSGCERFLVNGCGDDPADPAFAGQADCRDNGVEGGLPAKLRNLADRRKAGQP